MPEILNRETGEIITLTDEQLAFKREQLLSDWYTTREAAIEAKAIIEKEQALRKEVATYFFTDPAEGVNNYDLTEGFKLKLTYKIDRKMDEAAIPAVKEQLKEMGVSIDSLIEYKPGLVLKEYRGLAQVNKDAAKVFEQCLIIKPASPTLELVAPKS